MKTTEKIIEIAKKVIEKMPDMFRNEKEMNIFVAGYITGVARSRENITKSDISIITQALYEYVEERKSLYE